MKTAAFIFHDSDLYSGATRSLIDLLETFQKRKKFRIIAVLPDQEGTAAVYLKEKNIPVITHPYAQIGCGTDEGLLRYLYHFPERLRKNIINFTGAAGLAEKLQKAGVELVYSNTGFIITGALLKKKLPYVRHIWHLREFGEEDHHRGIFFGRKLYYHLLNKYTDHVIVISKALKEKFSPYITKPDISVIYDDISPAYSQRITEAYEYNESLSVLTAGLICEGKGQLQVLEAVKILNEWKVPVELYIAGGYVDKAYQMKVEAFIREYKMDSYVHYLGIVRDMNALRKKVKFGVVASASEAFGRVTIEGMLSGMLMLGADAAGTSELITDGRNGILYESGSSCQLASKLRELYNDPEKVNRIRWQAYCDSEKYTKGFCARQVEKILLG